MAKPGVGRHTAYAGKRSVYIAKSGVLCFAMECIVDPETRITAYESLTCKDGTPNNRRIESLKDALGWPGGDPVWLQEADLSNKPFDITVEQEEDGRLVVQWINPVGDGPFPAKGNRQQILAKFGPMFRAAALPWGRGGPRRIRGVLPANCSGGVLLHVAPVGADRREARRRPSRRLPRRRSSAAPDRSPGAAP